MVKPKIWTGLEAQVHNVLSEQIELIQELLAGGEGSMSDAERAEWRGKLRNARAELRELEERVQARR